MVSRCFSTFEIWELGQDISNTHSNMQHVKLYTSRIRGNVRQLRLPCVWVRFSVKLPVYTHFSWYKCNWLLFPKWWPYFGRYTVLPQGTSHSNMRSLSCTTGVGVGGSIRCWNLLTQSLNHFHTNFTSNYVQDLRYKIDEWCRVSEK
jgi:hypothetical protein